MAFQNFLTPWPKKRAPKKHYKNRGFRLFVFGKRNMGCRSDTLAVWSELIFGKGMRTATFQFSESAGSMNGPNLFTALPFRENCLRTLHSLNCLPPFSHVFFVQVISVTNCFVAIPFPKIGSQSKGAARFAESDPMLVTQGNCGSAIRIAWFESESKSQVASRDWGHKAGEVSGTAWPSPEENFVNYSDSFS